MSFILYLWKVRYFNLDHLPTVVLARVLMSEQLAAAPR